VKSVNVQNRPKESGQKHSHSLSNKSINRLENGIQPNTSFVEDINIPRDHIRSRQTSSWGNDLDVAVNTELGVLSD